MLFPIIWDFIIVVQTRCAGICGHVCGYIWERIVQILSVWHLCRWAGQRSAIGKCVQEHVIGGLARYVTKQAGRNAAQAGAKECSCGLSTIDSRVPSPQSIAKLPAADIVMPNYVVGVVVVK